MTISSSNAVLIFTAGVIFPQPYQLQKFSADNIFDTDPIPAGETRMGVDGNLTAGFINASVKQTFYLMADSPSQFFFDQLYAQEKALQDKIPISGTQFLRSVGKKWNMVRGFLVQYQPIPKAAKVLESTHHVIEWQSADPMPV